jgi:hypothetical protein
VAGQAAASHGWTICNQCSPEALRAQHQCQQQQQQQQQHLGWGISPEADCLADSLSTNSCTLSHCKTARFTTRCVCLPCSGCHTHRNLCSTVQTISPPLGHATPLLARLCGTLPLLLLLLLILLMSPALGHPRRIARSSSLDPPTAAAAAAADTAAAAAAATPGRTWQHTCCRRQKMPASTP